MKKTLATVIISFLISIQSNASCLEIYDDKITLSYIKGGLSTTTATATAYISIFSTSIGISLIQSGETVQGILSTIGSNVPGGGISFSSIREIINIVTYNRVRNLIEQSEVSFGDLLSETAEEISEELGKDVTEQEVSELIVQANNNKLFCSLQSNVYKFPDVYNYLVEGLK